MPVLHRDALEASPLADLHAIASELGIDGFRRLRKAELIDRILRDSGGDDGPAPEEQPRTTATPPARAAGGRDRRRRGRARPTRAEPTSAGAAAAAGAAAGGPRRAPGRRRDGPGDGDADPAEPSARPRRDDRGRRRAAGQRLGLRARVAARAVRRRRLHLRRPGAPLRAGLRRPRLRPGAQAAALGALPVARARGHHQRRAGRGGRRGHALRRAAVRLPVGAPGARLRGPDAEGDRVADPDRPRLARGHHRRRAGGQDRDPAPPRRGAGGRRGARAQPRAHRRAPRGGRRVEGRSLAPAAALTLAAGSDAQGQALERAIETAQRIAARGGHAVVLVDTLDAIAPRRRPPRAGRGARHRRRRLADGDRHRHQRRWAARRRSSASTPRAPRRATSRRSTSRPAARCARSCWSATRAPTPSPGARRRWRGLTAGQRGW